MNDRHPSGSPHPAGTADDVGHPATGYPGLDGGWAAAPGGHPLDGHHWGGPPPYGASAPASPYGQDPYGQAAAYGDGRHETTAWDNTPAHGIPRYEIDQAAAAYAGTAQPSWDTAGGYQDTGWDTGAHPTGSWQTGGWAQEPAPAYAGWDGGTANDWDAAPTPVGWATTADGWAHDGTGHAPAEHHWSTGHEATGGHDAVPDPGWHETGWSEREWPHDAWSDTGARDGGWHESAGLADQHTRPFPVVEEPAAEEPAEPTVLVSTVGHHEETPEPPVGYRPADGPPPSRRRRSKPKRSALLTVAAPSLCVLGVTAVAASAITKPGTDEPSQSEEDLPLAAEVPDEAVPVEANLEFDTQLESLTAAADDYADRASRTQGRMDLEEREAEEQRQAEEEAARIEAERPKYALPVEQRGLTMGFNQAGFQWANLHTGIDFPVSEGTPVRAVTDGTVRTLVNPSYGNLAIVTAPDGTETWYAHLSSTVIHSGQVQAGDVIAYSGNTGNSFGPHLHLEVRPGGGSPVDPAAWLRERGLDPEY